MFKVFNRKKKQVDLLENPISPVIVNELGGIGELTFSVPSTYKHLELEGYIQVENDHEYVIKEIVTHGTNRDVVCMLNIEEVLGMAWSKFISRDNTLMKCAELVLSGTGWRAINKSTCNVKRNLYGTVTNSYNLLQMMCTVYNVEFIFDTYNKTVTFLDKVGKDAGVYFINDINLKQLNVDTHTHKYITRVIPIGKNGLTIESVNGGKNYLENKSYSNKNIYGIWQSDKHDDPSALKADAKRFLDEMAIPYETYEVVVDDLYALKGYDEFKYGLGDIVTIIDGDTETRIQQRIIQRTYNLLEPDKDTIHIANKDATFEDYYKRLQTIADMTQSVIGSDGTISGGSISDGTISGDKIENDSINSDHISSGSITATHIKAEQILADHIMSNQITTNHLVANSITSDHIQANTIDTKHLKANTITSDHIQSNTINSNHISANTITSGHIQSGAITAGSGIIADGAIGNAQISNIDAGKIEAGTIDTSKVTIQGANGHLRLKGNRMQVFQGVGNQAKERVSVGDVNGDGTVYGLRVRGADGQTILLDENGVKSEGITDGSITNDKINEDANIDGAKLNINSVINRINTDGTEVIQGTKIEVDGTNLGVKLSEITNKQTSDGERITQAQAQITANQNAIKLKVDEQTYTTDKKVMTSKLEKNTSEISTMKGQIALKVEQTDIDNAKNEINNSVDTKIASAKSELKVTTNGISQKVGKLETTTTTLTNKVNTAQNTADSVNNKIDKLEIGNINLFNYGDFSKKNILDYWAISSTSFHTKTIGTYSGFGKGSVDDAHIKDKRIFRSRVDIAKAISGGIAYGRFNIITSNNVHYITVKANTEYTFSYWVYKSNNCGETYATVWKVQDDGSAVALKTSPKISTYTGTFVRNSVTFVTNDATTIYIAFYNKYSTSLTSGYSDVHIYQPLLTLGSKIVDWTPSKLDVELDATGKSNQALTDAKNYTNTQITTVNNKVASIQTDLNGITSRVTNTETSIKTINNNVTNLTNRVATAESKITETAITNTVKKNFYTKNDIDSKGYQTSSQVQQTVDNLEIKFQQSGGYNLLYNGDFRRGTDKWSVSSGFSTSIGNGNYSSPDRRGFAMTGQSGATGYLSQNISDEHFSSLNYTLSGYVYVSSSGTDDSTGTVFHYYVRLGYSDGTYTYHRCNWDKTTYNKWHFTSITFSRDTSKTLTEIRVSLSIQNTTRKIYLSQAMLEQGSNYTGWSPNPNEVYDGITTIDKDGITVSSTNTNTTTKMNSNGFYINQSGQGDIFKVDSNGISLNQGVTTIDKNGVKVTHSNGDYSQMNSSGFLRYVGGSKKTYHYLMSSGTVNVRDGQTATVTLPSEFKGKNFKVTVSAFKVNIISGWRGVYDIDSFVSSVDTTNGRFTVKGMVNDVNGLEGTLDVSYVVIA